MLDILLGLLSAFFAGVALFLQKIGIKNEIKKTFLSPKWLLGTFLSIVSFFIYLLALKLGGRLVIIQPLINVSILFMILLETVFLKNKIKWYDILSLLLFFFGLVLIQVRI